VRIVHSRCRDACNYVHHDNDCVLKRYATKCCAMFAMQDTDEIDDATDSAAHVAKSTDAQQQHSSSISSSSSANQQQQSVVASLYSEDAEASSIDILLHQKPLYGFNNAFSGFLSGLREELIDMVQLPTPDTVM
jgi:hypothetical protein